VKEREKTRSARISLSFSLRSSAHKTAAVGVIENLLGAHCAHINFKDKIFIILIIKRERAGRKTLFAANAASE
jgi:hypothetical protein